MVGRGWKDGEWNVCGIWGSLPLNGHRISVLYEEGFQRKMATVVA